MTSAPKAREIRAVFDDTTIIVYQAYNAEIAEAAVKNQRLDASPLWKPGRRTWIKPSWNWMMYRAGYSYKDDNQSNILAIKIKRDVFHDMLRKAILADDREAEKTSDTVRVQWDPERNVRIEKLVTDKEAGKIRSIQIGIAAKMKLDCVEHGIVSIEDVTDRARELKKVLDGDKNIGVEELVSRGLIPKERIYELPDDVARIVGISDS